MGRLVLPSAKAMMANSLLMSMALASAPYYLHTSRLF